MLIYFQIEESNPMTYKAQEAMETVHLYLQLFAVNRGLRGDVIKTQD